jgi:phosphopantetheine--protein transferase-like protein
MTHAAGMDIVDVAEARASVEHCGASCLERADTARELSHAHTGLGTRMLAALFAAKEAALKALDVRDRPTDRRSIKVVSRNGTTTAMLSGPAHSRAT